MPAASRSRELAAMWNAWNAEQRVAAVGATLLIVSTLGPFSWIEVAIVLVGVAVRCARSGASCES